MKTAAPAPAPSPAPAPAPAPAQGELTVISRAANSRKRAEMLQDMHYRNISQRLGLIRRSAGRVGAPSAHALSPSAPSPAPCLHPCPRTEEAAKYLEQTKLQTSNGFTEEFSVMEDLMGLAIGITSWPPHLLLLAF